MPRLFRKVLIGATAATGVTIPACIYVAYKYRSRSSKDVDFHEKLHSSDRNPNNYLEASLLWMSKFAVLSFVSTVVSAWMHACHDLDLITPEQFRELINSDRGGVPLLTVCNHTSVMDDPGLMSAIVPLPARISPKKMRWGLCTEEICFADPQVATFFTCGKALPAQRGGSIYQKGIATLQSKLNNGDWAHIFPEGRVWQEGGIPLRDAEGRWCSQSGRCGKEWRKVGPAKWGVGKLVANSEKTPIVLPFFHMGMNDIMPQDHENQCMTDLPVSKTKKVTVKFGEPVRVADLLEEYHRKALERALARNVQREKRLAEVQRRSSGQGAAAAGKDAGSSSSSTGSGWGWWWSWLWPAAAGGAAAAAATTAPAASGAGAGAAGGAGSPSPSLRNPSPPSSVVPINTVEELSDHTGASARVAGIAEPAPTELLQSEAAQEKGTIDAAELPSQLAAVAMEGVNKAMEMTSKAVEGVKELEEKARLAAEEVEARAKELVGLIWEAEQQLQHKHEERKKQQQQEKERKEKEAEGAQEGGQEAAAAAEPTPPFLQRVKNLLQGSSAAISSKSKEALEGVEHMSKQALEGGKEAIEGGKEALEQLMHRKWGSSVSVPAPAIVKVPSEQQGLEMPAAVPVTEAAVPVAAASVAGGVGAESSASSTAAGAAAMPAAPSASSAASATSGPRKAASLDAKTEAAAEMGLPAGSSALNSPLLHTQEGAGKAGSSSSFSSSSSTASTAAGSLSSKASSSSSGAVAGAGAAGAGAGAAVPLSESPVLEVIPTRTLVTGAVVPTYIEAPLRIKPPDHQFLSLQERVEEENFRLQLYSAIAMRVQEALEALEAVVVQRRKEQGIEEERAMK